MSICLFIRGFRCIVFYENTASITPFPCFFKSCVFVVREGKIFYSVVLATKYQSFIIFVFFKVVFSSLSGKGNMQFTIMTKSLDCLSLPQFDHKHALLFHFFLYVQTSNPPSLASKNKVQSNNKNMQLANNNIMRYLYVFVVFDHEYSLNLNVVEKLSSRGLCYYRSLVAVETSYKWHS